MRCDGRRVGYQDASSDWRLAVPFSQTAGIAPIVDREPRRLSLVSDEASITVPQPRLQFALGACGCLRACLVSGFLPASRTQNNPGRTPGVVLYLLMGINLRDWGGSVRTTDP